MTDTQRKARSHQWFGKADKDGFTHRSWMKNQGLPHHLFDGRPVIGICNTWSELTPCNAHFRALAERVKRGVFEMGGFPLEFPVMSLAANPWAPPDDYHLRAKRFRTSVAGIDLIRDPLRRGHSPLAGCPRRGGSPIVSGAAPT